MKAEGWFGTHLWLCRSYFWWAEGSHRLGGFGMGQYVGPSLTLGWLGPLLWSKEVRD